MRFERCHAQCPGFASILNGEVFLARYDRRGGLRLDQNEIFGRVHQLDRAGPIHRCGGRRAGLFLGRNLPRPPSQEVGGASGLLPDGCVQAPSEKTTAAARRDVIFIREARQGREEAF